MLLQETPVSIDIGPDSVRVAQLQEGRGGVRGIRFAEQRLPSGFRWEIGTDRAPLVEAIRAALSRAGIRARRAVISLPRRQVTARIGGFPPADRAELRQVVGYDLGDHIPFPVEQVVFDFQSLGHSRDQSGLSDVLVVAAQRELIAQYLALAQDLRLQVQSLTLDALALHDLTVLAGKGPPGLTFALEIGSRAATINVSEGERLLLSRSVTLGEAQLAAAIRDDLGVDMEEARRLLREEGLGVLERAPRSARTAAWLDNLLGEMRRSALSFGPAAVSQIFLVGGGAATPGLAEAIQRDYGVNVRRLSASGLFPNAQLRGESAEAADRCLLAIGQGLQGLGRSGWRISLIPGEVLAERRALRLRRAWVGAALVAVAVLAAGYGVAGRQIAHRQAEVDGLNQQQETAEQQRAFAEQLLAQRDHLRAQLATLGQARARRYAALELLRTITMYAPEGVVLTHFTMRPEQPLVIRGTAPTSAAVADLQAGLRRSPLVTRVSLDRADSIAARAVGPPGARRTSSGQAGKTVSFIITVHLWSEPEREFRSPAIALRGGRE